MNFKLGTIATLLAATTLLQARALDPLMLNRSSCTPVGSFQCIQQAQRHEDALRQYREDLAKWEECEERGRTSTKSFVCILVKPSVPFTY